MSLVSHYDWLQWSLAADVRGGALYQSLTVNQAEDEDWGDKDGR